MTSALRPAPNGDDEIETEIKQARAVIVCWSKASVVSRPVRAEALYARDHSKIVPCTLELCEIPLQLVDRASGGIFPVGLARPLMPAGEKCWSRSASASSGQAWRLSSTLVRRARKNICFPGRNNFPTTRTLRGFGLYQKDRSAAFRERNELRTRGDRGRGHAVRRDERKDTTKLLRRVRTMDRRISRQLPHRRERPRPVEALCAPGTSLDVAVLGKMASERDAAKADNKRLTVELEAAQAKIRRGGRASDWLWTPGRGARGACHGGRGRNGRLFHAGRRRVFFGNDRQTSAAANRDDRQGAGRRRAQDQCPARRPRPRENLCVRPRSKK